MAAQSLVAKTATLREGREADNYAVERRDNEEIQ